jgi:hypothetical protein
LKGWNRNGTTAGLADTRLDVTDEPDRVSSDQVGLAAVGERCISEQGDAPSADRRQICDNRRNGRGEANQHHRRVGVVDHGGDVGDHLVEFAVGDVSVGGDQRAMARRSRPESERVGAVAVSW